MGFNPNDESKVKRLRESMKWSSKKLSAFRKDYMSILKQYCGHYYGDGGTQEKIPVNMIKLAIDIYTRSLTSGTPRVLVTTHNLDLRSQARELQIATNNDIREINLRETLRDVVKSALFCPFGIMKIGVTPNELGEAENYLFDAGQVFCDSVLFDDWNHDMTARKFEELSWCGNRYRLPYDLVMESPLFENKKGLKANDSGDGLHEGDERSSKLSQGDDIQREEYEDHIDLWDIWLPREGLIVTLADENDSVKPLRVVEWDGPERGPFRLLYFATVPGNLIPSAPINHLFDLHDIINRLYLKLGRQGERQKTILAASGAATEDARQIMNAGDGEVVIVNHPDQVKEYRTGGIDGPNASFAMSLLERFSYQAGNLDVMGGLSQQAETATQEKILKASSSQQIADMQERVVNFTRDVVNDMSWHRYSDPVAEVPLVMQLDGYDHDIPFKWGPERREADFFEFNFQIEPYSLQARGPGEKLQTIMSVLGQLLLPAAQAGAVTIKWDEVLGLIAQYSDTPEIRIIAEAAMAPQMPAQGQPGGGGGKPAQTTRNYVRSNVPTGGTQQSRDHVLQQQLMSGGGAAVNQQQQAAQRR